MPASIIEYLYISAIGTVFAAVTWLWKKVIMLDRETALLIQLIEERERRRIESERARDAQHRELLSAIRELRAEILKLSSK